MEGEAGQSGIGLKYKTLSGQHVGWSPGESTYLYIAGAKQGGVAYRDPAGAS